MKILARDIMTTGFHTLRPDMPIADAVRMFQSAGEQEGRKVFGMMVTDDQQRLLGLLSMYDILLYMRPKHIHIWGEMEDIDVAGLVETACKKVTAILVGDIMSTEVVTVSPDTHLMMILDIMIKKHIRRLPVVDGEKILGIVYISDLFYHLLDRLTDTG
jgi:CBS domain-containing protein